MGPDQTFLTDLFEKNPDGVLHVSPAGRILAANQSAMRLLGEDGGGLLGRDLRDCAFGAELRAAVFRGLVDALAGTSCDVSGTLIRSDGKPMRVRTYLNPLHNGQKVSGVLVVLRDITAQWEADQRLTSLAYTDDLTGLPNRNRFLECLHEALMRSRLGGAPVAVIYLDVDRFKVINDTLGPKAGDQLLQEVADRLARALPRGAVLARLAADEFVVMLENVLAVKQVVYAAKEMQAQIEAPPFQLDGHEVYVTILAGIAMHWPVDGLGKNPENTAIVRAVITFARTLRMSVTGEGIETMEQLRELKLLGCDRGQGYLFSRPVTAEEIQHLIANL